MDVSEAIEKRTSIRKYKDKPVSDDVIKQLIEAAHNAPSGNNAQPWHFYVVKKGETMQKLKEHKIFYQDFLYEAPVVIVCAANPAAYTKEYEGWDSAKPLRAIRDLSIASGFLVLKAAELGLGTCLVGWVKKEEIKPLLAIPEEYVVPYVIPLGYPDEKGHTRKRKALDDVMKVV